MKISILHRGQLFTPELFTLLYMTLPKQFSIIYNVCICKTLLSNILLITLQIKICNKNVKDHILKSWLLWGGKLSYPNLLGDNQEYTELNIRQSDNIVCQMVKVHHELRYPYTGRF